MNVPPYVPEPIEIPENVAEEKHAVRVRFIRRVVLLHFGSLALICALAFASPWSPGLAISAVLAMGVLLLLSLIRGLVKGRPVELRLSFGFGLLLLPAFGFLVKDLVSTEWPVWALMAGPSCAAIYILFCGRDLSFVGMFVLCLLVSSVGVSATSLGLRSANASALEALGLNAAYLAYLVYDLAALQTRRRVGEEVAAVVDLYRDLLNMFTYSIRVWNHWRKYNVRSGYVVKGK